MKWKKEKKKLPNKTEKKMKQISHFFQSNTLHINGIVGAVNLLLGIGKIISGILSLSVFVCVNGCYTLGMAIARYCAVVGSVRAKEEKSQYHYYWLSGIVMIFASLAYVSYSLWSIYHPKIVEFREITAITIATITFTEIGVNLSGVLKHRKSKTPLLHAFKTISLGTSLISLVLTQSAILSFESKSSNPAVNGILGTIMGGCATLLGVYMIWRINKIRKEDNQCREETC